MLYDASVSGPTELWRNDGEENSQVTENPEFHVERKKGGHFSNAWLPLLASTRLA